MEIWVMWSTLVPFWNCKMHMRPLTCIYNKEIQYGDSKRAIGLLYFEIVPHYCCCLYFYLNGLYCMLSYNSHYLRLFLLLGELGHYFYILYNWNCCMFTSYQNSLEEILITMSMWNVYLDCLMIVSLLIIKYLHEQFYDEFRNYI